MYTLRTRFTLHSAPHELPSWSPRSPNICALRLKRSLCSRRPICRCAAKTWMFIGKQASLKQRVRHGYSWYSCTAKTAKHIASHGSHTLLDWYFFGKMFRTSFWFIAKKNVFHENDPLNWSPPFNGTPEGPGAVGQQGQRWRVHFGLNLGCPKLIQESFWGYHNDLVQLIGLRENIHEYLIFPGKINGFRLRFSFNLSIDLWHPNIIIYENGRIFALEIIDTSWRERHLQEMVASKVWPKYPESGSRVQIFPPACADSDGLVQTSGFLRLKKNPQTAIPGELPEFSSWPLNIDPQTYVLFQTYKHIFLDKRFVWPKSKPISNKFHWRSTHMFIFPIFFFGKSLALDPPAAEKGLMTLRTMATGNPGVPHVTSNASRVRRVCDWMLHPIDQHPLVKENRRKTIGKCWFNGI